VWEERREGGREGERKQGAARSPGEPKRATGPRNSLPRSTRRQRRGHQPRRARGKTAPETNDTGWHRPRTAARLLRRTCGCGRIGDAEIDRSRLSILVAHFLSSRAPVAPRDSVGSRRGPQQASADPPERRRRPRRSVVVVREESSNELSSHSPPSKTRICPRFPSASPWPTRLLGLVSDATTWPLPLLTPRSQIARGFSALVRSLARCGRMF
jgi:hypothetical protein